MNLPLNLPKVLILGKLFLIGQKEFKLSKSTACVGIPLQDKYGTPQDKHQ